MQIMTELYSNLKKSLSIIDYHKRVMKFENIKMAFANVNSY
jgi:hypothetical protein